MNEGKIKAADANLSFGRLGIGAQSNPVLDHLVDSSSRLLAPACMKNVQMGSSTTAARA
jgi:hypothetical protein